MAVPVVDESHSSTFSRVTLGDELTLDRAGVTDPDPIANHRVAAQLDVLDATAPALINHAGDGRSRYGGRVRDQLHDRASGQGQREHRLRSREHSSRRPPGSTTRRRRSAEWAGDWSSNLVDEPELERLVRTDPPVLAVPLALDRSLRHFRAGSEDVRDPVTDLFDPLNGVLNLTD